MAFPVVASITSTGFSSSSTTHDVAMPATVNSGDLLIILFGWAAATTLTTPGGWTSLEGSSAGPRIRHFAKSAAGTEGGGTINVASAANTRAAAIVFRITGWSGGSVASDIISAITSGSLDPASHTPGFSGDILWIATAGSNADTTFTGFPTGYSDGTSQNSAGGGGATTKYTVGAAWLQANGSSENPSAFTVGSSTSPFTGVVAVKPAAAGPDQSVSPAVLSLTAGIVAPTRLDHRVSPDVAARTLTPVAWDRIDPQVVVPNAVALTAGTVAPARMDQRTEPGALGLAVATVSPTIQFTVNPGPLALTGAAVAPSRMDQTIAAGVASRTIGVIAPRTDQETRPNPLGLALSPVAPARIDLTVNPAAAARTLTAVAPSIPTLDQTVSPNTLGLVATTVAPTRLDQAVTPGALAFIVTPVAPTIQGPGAQTVSPNAVSLTALAVAPSRIDEALTPSSVALAITPLAPTPRADQQVQPNALGLTAGTVAPRVDLAVGPATYALTLTVLQPTRLDENVVAAIIALAVQAIAPTVTGGTVNVTGGPAPLAVAFRVIPTGYAITVAPEGDATAARPSGDAVHPKPEAN